VKSDTQKLAERIARLLESEQQGGDLASVFASLEKISHRLDKLEGSLKPQSPVLDPQLNHPSQEKFAVIEAVAEQIISGIKQEKTCTFEPNGRPCDHCSMCSSRGF
jgi:hypothetical protein